jgi:hypothetical protein
MEDSMATKIVENACLGKSLTSYLGSMFGVLTSSKLWTGPLWKLAGMTGCAFHFIIHQKTCPSSVTVYDWLEEHTQMMDRIGVDSECTSYWMDPKSNMFQKMQDRANVRIKESLDRDMAVTVWAPTSVLEFGIIKGYDDSEQVFFVEDCLGQGTQHLLYPNLGLSEVACLFYQIVYDRSPIDEERIVRSSLTFGVKEWKREQGFSPSYVRGRKGYDALMNALEKKEYDYFGLSYILAVYLDSKSSLAQYMKWISGETKYIPGLEETVFLFNQISGLFCKMTKLIPFSPPRPCTEKTEKKLSDSEIKEMLSLIKECRDLESHAMRVIEKRLEE